MSMRMASERQFDALGYMYITSMEEYTHKITFFFILNNTIFVFSFFYDNL